MGALKAIDPEDREMAQTYLHGTIVNRYNRQPPVFNDMYSVNLSTIRELYDDIIAELIRRQQIYNAKERG